VDGAVSTLSGRPYRCEIVDLGAVHGSATAVMGAPVRKRGRTTLLTYGFVDGLSLTVNVDYGDGLGLRTLANQISIRPDTAHNPKFSDHGDSGSVVVDANMNVVGLLFAGSSDGSSVANPIAAVLTELGVTLCVGGFKKIEIKENIKEFKDHVKEGKDIIKDRKESYKDLKDVKEKDVKELKEFDKPIKEIDKIRDKIREVGPVIPSQPVQSGYVDERLRALEEAVGQLSAFITSELRPDLSTGALSQEQDYGCTSAKLEKEANDAVQSKISFDNKASR
jgi:hypothetical protein